MNPAHQSLWLGTAPETSYPSLQGDRVVDVAILGGGITGLTTALRLQEAGARVAVVERYRIATGTTGNTTAKVTILQGLVYSELVSTLGAERAGLYALANARGVDEVLRLIEQYDISCDPARLPTYTYARTEEDIPRIRQEVEACNRVGITATFVTDTDLPFAVAGAVRVDAQLCFQPVKYCQGLAAAITAGGGEIYEHTSALDVEDGEPCTVKTDGGTIRARHVIISTLLPFPLKGEYFAKAFPSRSYALAARIEGELPEGMFLSMETPTRSIRPHRSPEGNFLVVEGDAHKTGEGGDTRRYYDDLESWARERFPIQSIEYLWSAQDYMTGDHVPFSGRITSGTENVLIATGFNKWGMSNGTAAAILMSERVLGRDVRWADLYDAGRWDLAHGGGEIIRENLDVAREFIGDRIEALGAESLTNLAAGNANVVKRSDGKLVAAYRDRSGALHQVSPMCTHLGCLVHWNDAEESWDCPCHGSRFSYTGEVLEGPATRNLETMDSSDSG